MEYVSQYQITCLLPDAKMLPPINTAKMLPISFDDMKDETLKDDTLQAVSDYIIKG